MTYLLGAIFARGGSKGLPRKNLRLLAGKPLIAHAIEVGLQVPELDRLIVSTDDPEIARVGREYGADVPFLRPDELAADDSPEWAAWQHAVRTVEEARGGDPVTALVSIPATAPLRNVGDVRKCIRKLVEADADVVISVTSSDRNPHFNMVIFDDKGSVHIAAPLPDTIARRQDAPAVYSVTPVAYAVRRDFLLESSSMFEGNVRAVSIPRERAIDIDTEFDLRLAECLMGEIDT